MADPSVPESTPHSSTPVPDPTALTDKAIAKVEKSLISYVDGKYELLDQRDVLRDREIGMLLRERDEKIKSLDELTKERHGGLVTLVEEKFSAAERQRLEQKKDTKDAVEAALTAQKEQFREQNTASALAIAKSETAMMKQLEQQALTVATAVDSLRRSIDEVKERAVEENRAIRSSISEVATSTNGIVQQKVGAKEDRTGIYAAVGFGISIILVLIALAGFLIARLPAV